MPEQLAIQLTPADGLIYLASPYSDPDPAVMEERFLAVSKVAAKLMAAGLWIFSPIAHTHPIALQGDLPRGWDYWAAYDRAMIQACSKVAILTLRGWDRSRGVEAERQIAAELGKPVVFLDADGEPFRFSLSCRGTMSLNCDAGDHLETPEAAHAAGWTDLDFDDGPSWNFLGLCPLCRSEEEAVIG